MQVVRHQLPASHVSLWLETSEPHITTPFPGPGVFSLETPPVLEELCNTPSSGIAECQRGWWCHQSEVIILLASGEQTWRQQCQGRVSAKKSIMVMPLDSSVAHRACCHLPSDSLLRCSVCRLWDKGTPNIYTGITWGSGLSLDTLVLLLPASGLVTSACPPGEGHLKPPPLGVTLVDAERFWGLYHWSM